MQEFTASVQVVRDLTHDVREIRLRLIQPARISFKPGQFISFEVAIPGFPRPGMRPYSIISSPNKPYRVDLVLNRVEGGPGSSYLFGLKPGPSTRFKGPAGTFYLRESTKRLLFVATGTGIAPFRSMLASLVERGLKALALRRQCRHSVRPYLVCEKSRGTIVQWTMWWRGRHRRSPAPPSTSSAICCCPGTLRAAPRAACSPSTPSTDGGNSPGYAGSPTAAERSHFGERS
jgi:hypothetical protein